VIELLLIDCSLTVDTACSSSLYALHLACQSLILGDCTAAIVGGTNVIMDVAHQLTATKLGILSPTSTCHTFDEAADGFGRGDGMTAVYIKKLSDAMSNGDPIRAIIRATAVNTNGRGHGISHPGYLGQQEVIKKAHETAGLDPKDTAYIECHGTGTPVGDPIEVAAIGAVFAADHTATSPLLLGALKPNIGHGEGASGISSVIKVVMSLENAQIPATIGVRKLNPSREFDVSSCSLLMLTFVELTWRMKACA
jgi:acyl transferase domain-containing protein